MRRGRTRMYAMHSGWFGIVDRAHGVKVVLHLSGSLHHRL